MTTEDGRVPRIWQHILDDVEVYFQDLLLTLKWVSSERAEVSRCTQSTSRFGECFMRMSSEH